MKVSDQALFQKMEDELKQAKQGGAEQKAHLHALKILTELALSETKTDVLSQNDAAQIVSERQKTVPPALNQGKKLDMSDDANGDSLFDF
ncbi:YwdI family protein [Listeria fleischmannii]|uniref:YwdI family protein n=1 Tax=Listeria fleischmannii TaxID=1069827 RepID=UPI00162A9836|nr:YwdI family protein [Listeria fleischmannii]MBC1419579.1 YwdI family protein [Listeria fleischmannii]